MRSLRLVFAGSPAAAVPSLQALLAGPHEVAAVVTREDAPLGRRRVLTPTPVAELAEAHGVAVIKANRLGPVTERILALQPDLGVIVAYGGLVREPLLSGPALGWINLHFSLLPRWRGAAPVQHALIAGDELTGASVFQLVDELDAGDLFGTLAEPIGAFTTAGHLLEQLAASGARLLADVVDALAEGTARAEPQTGEPTLAPKLTIDDGRLDTGRSADELFRRIRGVTPEPGAFLDDDGGGQRLKVLEAAPARDTAAPMPGEIALQQRRVLLGTADGALELLQVQPAGKRPMSAADWWRGRVGRSAS